MYKIKFQSGLLTNPEQTESTPVYSESSYSDADVKEVAKLWKILGYKKVESIELSGNCKMSYPEVVDLFYPEVIKHGDGTTESISDHDKAAKAKLLAMAPVADEPKQDHRADLFARLEAAGVKMPRNSSTEKLEAKVAEL